MPPPLTQISNKIEHLFGRRPLNIMPLSGGCVGDVYKAVMPDENDLVIKVGKAEQDLLCEGSSLRYLAQNTSLPVPEVHFSTAHLLIMDFVENHGRLGNTEQHHAAELIAKLHNITPSPHPTSTRKKRFGFAHATVIGGLPQPNPWGESWVDFFRDHRLMYMGRCGETAGRLPRDILHRLERFSDNLDRWLCEPEQPSLIHGDLWAGNILTAHGRITGMIDPAIYFADPEIELAFVTLFNTFGDAFFQRYTEIRSLRPGFFKTRRDIYNLYPLLVHVRLFGGGYVSSVERTLARFGY